MNRRLIIILFLPVVFAGRGQEAMEQLDHIIAPSPDAAALTRAADIPVSQYTGMPNITVPLWTMKGNTVSVAISLAYHSNGLRVAEVPGWTGQGWSLQAGGSITRSVQGNPDDWPNGYLYAGRSYLQDMRKNSRALWQWQPAGANTMEKMEFLREVAAGRIDLEPDIFYFTFNGHSGKFVLDAGGNPVPVTPVDMDLRYFTDPDGKIVKWLVTDESGVKYVFGGEEAAEKSTHNDSHGSLAVWFYSTWHLSRIISPNGEDTFVFHYFPHTVTYRYPVPLRKKAWKPPSRGDLFNYTLTTTEEKHLKKIEQVYPGALVHVDFEADTMGGFPGGIILALKKMTVVHPVSHQYDRIFTFDYSFFPATGCGTEQDYLYPCRRLRLDKITESAGGRSNPPYRFFYDPQPLPPRGSFSQDYWGYYNGKKNASPVPALRVVNTPVPADSDPPARADGAVNIRWFLQANLHFDHLEKKVWELPGADLSPDTLFVQAGILKRIVYPTGGETLLEYEPNRAGFLMMPEPPQRSTVWDYFVDTLAVTSKLALRQDQQITLWPLFYKNDDQGVIGDSSGIYIVKKGVIFDTSFTDTVFSFFYSELEAMSAGMEAQLKIWLEKGEYRIVAKTLGKGSITGVVVYARSGSVYDKIYRVYSNDYETRQVQAGLPHFPDDSAYRVVKVFHLAPEDDRLVHVHYYFRSDLHPNVIPTAGLPIPNSRVVLTRIDDQKILFVDEYTEHDSLGYSKTDGYFKYGEEAMLLEPGDYRVEFYPRIPGEAGYLRVIWEKAVATHPYVTAGGVRLKRKIQLDHARDTIGRVGYEYKTHVNNTEWSSGVLMRLPLYYDEPERIFYLGEGNISGFLPVNIYANSRAALGSTSGSHIGYAEVAERIPGAGTMVTRYVSALDYPDISQNFFPFPAMMTFDWKRGAVREQTAWSADGTIRRRTGYEYNGFDDSVYRFTLPSVRVARYDTAIYAIRYAVSGTCTGWNHPVRKTTVRYDSEGKNAYGTVEKYRYDTSFFRIRETETLTSDSVSRKMVFTYTTDRPDSSAPLDTLLARHMHNVKLQEEMWLDSVKTGGNRTFYGLFEGGSIVAPDSVQVLEGNRYRTVAWFDRYDKKARLLQYHKRGEVYHSFNYDDYGHVIIRADNAQYRSDTAAYPPEALVTHYRQDPFFGITAVTGPGGRTTRYLYDPFGRLETVRDRKNRILKKVNYHYRQYEGDTSRAVFSGADTVRSLPPEGIAVAGTVVPAGCPVTLAVTGGALAGDAVWHWYAGGCGVNPAGAGDTITIYPQRKRTASWYVRAEGSANITPCAAVTLTVEEPAFHPDRDTLSFGADGSQHPLVVLTGYTGCDPWTAAVNGEGFSIREKNESSVSVWAGPNDGDTLRTGTLTLRGNACIHTLPLVQQGREENHALELTLSYQPHFVTEGTQVQVTGTAANGTSPYTFSWERQDDGEGSWTPLGSDTTDNEEDTITTVAGTVSFTIRCTVYSGGESVSRTVRIVIAE